MLLKRRGSWCLFYVLEAVAVTAALRNSGVVRQTQVPVQGRLLWTAAAASVLHACGRVASSAWQPPLTALLHWQAQAVNQLHLLPQKLLPLSLDTLKNGLLRGLEKSSLSRLPPALPAAEQAVAQSLPELPAGPLAFLDDDDIPVPAPERR